MTSQMVLYMVAGAVGVLVLQFLVTPHTMLGLYIQAKFSEAPIPLGQLIKMRLAGVDPATITYSHIRMVKGTDLNIPVSDLVKHFQAGGRLPFVVNALITAKIGGFDLSWEEACIADLEGRDVLAEAQERLEEIRAAESA